MKPIKLAAAALFLASLFEQPLSDEPSSNEGQFPTLFKPPVVSKSKAVQIPKAKPADIKPDRVVAFKEIVLKKGEAKKGELSLHVFNPQGHQVTDHSPAIVFFFGGGWNGGTPKQFYEQAKFFADHGFVAISAEYRVESRNKTTPFECVQDGKSAIRWVRSHAPELGVNSKQIVAAGGSAGGHVAVCTGIIKGHENKDEDLQV